MQTQKIHDDFYVDDDEDRGEVVALLTSRAQNKTHNLYRGSNQIGRGDQNDIVVEHATVSDVHAEIEVKDNSEAFVKDLRSSNGTFVETAPFSNDYTHLLKGQTLPLQEGCNVRFGLIQLVYTPVASVEHEDKVDNENEGGGQFDVESDDEREEGGVVLNLDLRGVIDGAGAGDGPPPHTSSLSTDSMFDVPTQEQALPTQDKKVGFEQEVRTTGRASIFDQETQKPDLSYDIDDEEENDENKSDAAHQQDNERSTLYDTATEVYTDNVLEDKKEQSMSVEEPTLIVDQLVPNLDRRVSSGSVESPTQIVPDNLDRRVSSGSVDSPTQIVPDEEDSETEVDEGEDDDDEADGVNVTLTSEEGTSGVASSVKSSTAKSKDGQPHGQTPFQRQDFDSEEDSGAESEEIMQNSQAELSQDAMKLILPPELQEDLQVVEENMRKIKDNGTEQVASSPPQPSSQSTVIDTTQEQCAASVSSKETSMQDSADKLQGGEDQYLTQVSPSKRVDIRVVEEESRGNQDLSQITRSLRGRPSLSEQLEAAEDVVESSTSSKVDDKESPVAKKRSIDTAEDEDIMENSNHSEADTALPQNSFPVSLSNLLPTFVQNLLPSPPSSASASAKKRPRQSTSATSDSPSTTSATPVAQPSRSSPSLDGDTATPIAETNRSAGRPQSDRNKATSDDSTDNVPMRRGDNIKRSQEKDDEEADTLQPQKKKQVRGKKGSQDSNKDEQTVVPSDKADNRDSAPVPTSSPPQKRATRGRAVKAVKRKAAPEPEPEPELEPKPEIEAKPEPVKEKNTRNRKRKATEDVREEAKEKVAVVKKDTKAGGDRSAATKRSKPATSQPSPTGRSARGDSVEGDDSPTAAKEPLPLRILITGVEVDDRLKRMVAKIGGKIVDIADMAGVTHVITGSSLKRTPKMLMALNLGACYVVGVNWLEDSAQKSSPIAIDLLSPSTASAVTKKAGRGRGKKDNYLIYDHEKEVKWAPFKLVDTLTHNVERLNSPDESNGLLDGLGIFVANDVFGNGAPSRDEMRLIVESGGGTLLTTAAEVTKFDKGQHSKGGIVLVHKDVKKAPAKAIVAFAKEFEESKGLYTVEFLFSAIMRQQIDFDTGLVSHIAI